MFALTNEPNQISWQIYFVLLPFHIFKCCEMFIQFKSEWLHFKSNVELWICYTLWIWWKEQSKAHHMTTINLEDSKQYDDQKTENPSHRTLHCRNGMEALSITSNLLCIVILVCVYSITCPNAECAMHFILVFNSWYLNRSTSPVRDISKCLWLNKIDACPKFRTTDYWLLNENSESNFGLSIT